MSCPAHSLAATRLFLLAEDVDLIRESVAKLSDTPVIADIGAGSGTTALAILSENPVAKIYTIDHDAINVDWAKKNIEPYFDISKWTGIVSDSVIASDMFEDDYFNMILLDTSHEYEPTKREIESWLPKLKTGGIFWFHDYIGSGVKQAVDEAVEAYLLQKITQTGLGWAGKKL